MEQNLPINTKQLGQPSGFKEHFARLGASILGPEAFFYRSL